MSKNLNKSKIDLSKTYNQLSNNINNNNDKIKITDNNILESQTIKMNDLTTRFTKTINICHNILRTRHAIIGQNAHRHIMSIIFVRLIKSNLIDETDNLHKKFMSYINSKSGEQKEDLLETFRYMTTFELLIGENKSQNIIDSKWNEFILSELLSMVLPNVFHSENDRLKCDSITMETLLQTIEELGEYFDDNQADIRQHSYSISTSIFESFVNGYTSDGSQLGQFHTHRDIITIGIDNFVKPHIDECIEKGIFKQEDLTTYDACAGSGGFILENFFKLGLNPENLYGQEVDKLTMKHLFLNMILSTGEMPHNIHNKNSFTNVPDRKFHSQGLNPPFGLKGIKYSGKKGKSTGIKEEYESIPENNKEERPFDTIYPFASNKAENLFLQQAMNLMEDNGIVQIVLPYGELVFSNNKSFVKVRKELVEKRNIKAFILLPTDLFISTNIQTFMMIFTNEEETTKNIDFYKMVNGKLKLEKTISKEELSKNNYSFKLQTYEKEILNSNIEYIKLGDICNIKSGDFLPKKKQIKGNFDVIGGGRVMGSHNIYNREQENIILTRVGDFNIKFLNKQFFLTDNGFSINMKDENYLINFVFYYLKYNSDIVSKLYGGTAQKVISKTKLNKIKIPKYSLEKQQEIIQELEELDNISQNYKNQLKSLKKEQEFFHKYNNNDLKSLSKGKETVKLEDVINFEKKSKRAAKVGTKVGKYNFYKSGNKTFKSDFNDYQKEYIILGDGGVKLDLAIDSNFSCSDHNFIFNSKNKETITEFLYYYLKINIHYVRSLMTGVAIPNLSKTSLKNIKIPKLSLEKQQKYIELAKKKMNKINSFEQRGEELKQHIGELNQIGKNIIIEDYEEITEQPQQEIEQPQINEIVEEIKEDMSEEEQSSEEITELVEQIIDYNKMKTSELKKECKLRGIKKYSKLKKAELISLLQ